MVGLKALNTKNIYVKTTQNVSTIQSLVTIISSSSVVAKPECDPVRPQTKSLSPRIEALNCFFFMGGGGGQPPS